VGFDQAIEHFGDKIGGLVENLLHGTFLLKTGAGTLPSK
jgi:hypothetical protein